MLPAGNARRTRPGREDDGVGDEHVGHGLLVGGVGDRGIEHSSPTGKPGARPRRDELRPEPIAVDVDPRNPRRKAHVDVERAEVDAEIRAEVDVPAVVEQVLRERRPVVGRVRLVADEVHGACVPVLAQQCSGAQAREARTDDEHRRGGRESNRLAESHHATVAVVGRTSDLRRMSVLTTTMSAMTRMSLLARCVAAALALLLLMVGGSVPAVAATVPSVSGTLKAGRTVTARFDIDKSPGRTVSYQWLRAGREIRGATHRKYAVRAADVGSRLRVRVTVLEHGELVSRAVSSATARVRADDGLGALEGRTIVVDAGHQLGNSRFLREIGRRVPAGYGRTKACNTTGTATNAGYPEATFNWRVSSELRNILEDAGATVLMTRTKNSRSLWGPCINKRAKRGNGKADILVSIHGDGAPARGHGAYAISPGTGHDDRRASYALGQDILDALVDAKFKRSTYVSGGSMVSNNYATLNLSKKPSVILELGNMRNSSDAKVMSSSAGQRRYARAIAVGIAAYFE